MRSVYRCTLVENELNSVEVACICEKGFEFVRENGVGRCLDIDECERDEEKSLCFPNSQCANDAGSFHCQCIDGKIIRFFRGKLKPKLFFWCVDMSKLHTTLLSWVQYIMHQETRSLLLLDDHTRSWLSNIAGSFYSPLCSNLQW